MLNYQTIYRLFSILKFNSILIIVLLFFAFSFCSCSKQNNESKEKIIIATSITPIKYIIDYITGDCAQTNVIVPRNMDPHDFEPTPEDTINLAKADIFFTIGLPFEKPLAEKALKSTKNKIIVVDLSEGMLENINGKEDPHIWLSPITLRVIADDIYTKMISYDRVNMDYYRMNHNRFIIKLIDTDLAIEKQLAPYHGKRFIIYHPALSYFAERYGIEQIAIEQEGKSPDPKHILDIIALAKKEKIHIIFAEPQFDRNAVNTIAKAINGKVVLIDPLPKDLFKGLKTIADKLEESFKK